MLVNRTAAMLSLGVFVALGAACSDSEPTSSTPAASTSTTTAAESDAADAPAVSGAFAGVVEGSDAYVALVVGPGSYAVAYVCDGASSVDFLDGPLVGHAATLGNDGGARLEATFTEQGVSGTFTRPDSEPLTFTAEPAAEPAGLYRAEASFADGLYVGGWVLLPDGTQRGAVRRYETPLPRGSVDATLDLRDPTVVVPGGVLTAHYVGSLDDV